MNEEQNEEQKDDWNVDQDRSRLNLDESDEYYLSKKPKWLIFVLIGILIAGVAALLYFLRPRQVDTVAEDARIAATIFPLYDIAKNVADGVTDVALVLPPNASPHTFEPSPRLVASLQEIEALYAIGHGLDEWAFELVPEEAGKIVVDKGLAIISTEDRHREGHDLGDADEHDEHEEGDGHDEHEEDEHGHEHGETDPHYWLSVPNGQMIARTIAADLIERFPGQKDRIEKNLEDYLDELDLVEAEIQTILRDIRNRKIITMHDAWYYFAVHHRLDIVGTFEPAPGREPTPRYLAELTDAVNSFGARVIYSEPQISTESIEAFAADRGLKIAELDPIGGVPGRETFKKLMKYNARTIGENQE